MRGTLHVFAIVILCFSCNPLYCLRFSKPFLGMKSIVLARSYRFTWNYYSVEIIVSCVFMYTISGVYSENAGKGPMHDDDASSSSSPSGEHNTFFAMPISFVKF